MRHLPSTAAPDRPRRTPRRRAALVAVGVLVGSASAGLVGAPAALADGPAPVAVTLTGGALTLTTPGGVLFAARTGVITVSAVTDPSATCVTVTSGAGALVTSQTSATPKASWALPLTVGAGDGVQLLTVLAGTSGSGLGCAQSGGAINTPGTGSYVLDNTGPVVTVTRSAQPNAQNWYNANLTLTYTAEDAGVGVAASASPVVRTTNGQTSSSGTTFSVGIRDLLGNLGGGSVVVRIDTTPPTISGSATPAPGVTGWNTGPVTVTFSCADALSGIQGGCPTRTLTQDGAGQSVTQVARDNADLTTSATVGPVNIDQTPPTLSGAPATEPNAAGWYRGDVVVRWDAADATSGLAAPVPDGLVTGEGVGLVVGATAADVAGNTTAAVSSPVRIDRTAPTTTVDATPDWVNTDQTLHFAAGDNLSGVAGTTSVLDEGQPQQGSTLTVTEEGVHTIRYWSTDRAGNREPERVAQVRIDRTAPTIGHTLSPLPNPAGWNRAPVTVTFLCADDRAGIASCTDPQTVSTEGAAQPVPGEAVDQAGNRTPDVATVNLDRTDPQISSAVDRGPNAFGWYRDPVRVGFSCADALSGTTGCPQPVTLAEGFGQQASGTVEDAAGNTATTTRTGIHVDTTAPELTGETRQGPGPDGWYSDDIAVDWVCSDALSGINGLCPDPSVVSGEGDALTATATVADLAGNPVTRTVTGIRIDRTAPTTTASVPDSIGGWYRGSVDITLEPTDGLSGVDRTLYRLDDGEPQVYTGPVAVTGTGTHRLTYWSVDVAGNQESSLEGHDVVVRVDGTDPTITGSVSPPANANGWHDGPVSVSFGCDDADSGLAVCEPGQSLTEAGAGQSLDGLATDLVGNTARTTVGGINIDLVPPTLTGTPTTDPNAGHWYNGDVTVAWAAADDLSGVDEDTRPAPTVVTGEGAGLSAGPVAVRDLAGNRAQASVTGLNIDRTAPAITGAPTEQPGPSGWYRGEVTVRFSCTDGLSGVATCPTEKVVTSNGAGRSVTSDPAKDMAGNAAAGVTVGGLDVDGLPPSTTSTTLCQPGTCTGGTVRVALTAADQPGLSGVQSLHYAVNGGEEQVVTEASAEVSVPLVAGAARLTYFAVDRAGNVEPVNSVALDGDQIAPSVSHTHRPAPNADGWNNSDVTISFTAKDDDSGSGVDPSSVTEPVLVTEETPAEGRVVVGSATDLAGNRGTDTVLVKLDRTSPTVQPKVTPPAGPSGWWTGPVTVHFDCRDALSGVAVCPDDVTLTGNGRAQSVTRTATDVAGNSRNGGVSDIRIDRELPTMGRVGVRNGAVYQLGAVPPPTCSGTDDVSGIASCVVGLEGPASGDVGTFRFTAVATDVAGNSTTVRGSYRVVYRFDGFSAPINDLRWLGVGFAVFRAGTTVPVRVQLKTASGTVVQGGSPTFVPPVRACLALLGVTEPPAPPGAGSVPFRWNPSTRTWEYLWDTRGLRAGYLYRVGVTLDDGRTYYAYIALA